MALVVRAFPLIRPVEELQAFLSALTYERREEADAFYRQYGITHDSAYVQETPSGPLLLVVTALESPHVEAPRYAATSEEFDAWFKAQILHLTGVDQNVAPLGPPSTEVYVWVDEASGGAV